jgi:hypothetical protein
MMRPLSFPGSPITAEVILRLTEVAAALATAHEDPEPASAVAVATTRGTALEVIFGYASARDREQDVPVYLVAMTGRFASYRGGLSRESLPRAGPYLTVVIDAEALVPLDVSMGDTGPRRLLSDIGPVADLSW